MNNKLSLHIFHTVCSLAQSIVYTEVGCSDPTFKRLFCLILISYTVPGMPKTWQSPAMEKEKDPTIFIEDYLWWKNHKRHNLDVQDEDFDINMEFFNEANIASGNTNIANIGHQVDILIV